MSEGLHSLQCYCPRLRHPEVINGLWGLPSRTPPRQKTLGWKSGTPLGCFTSAPRSRQKTVPLPSRVAAGKGTEERAGVCTCPPPRVVSHSRDGNGNGPGVAAERALAPTRWQQEKSRLHLSLSCFHSIGVGVSSAESPPPPFPPAFLSSQGDTANPFCHPCDFPSLAAGTRGSDGRGIAAGTATRGKYSRSQLCGPAPDREHTQPGMWSCSGNLSARYLECSRRTCAAVWEPLPPESAGAEREEG